MDKTILKTKGKPRKRRAPLVWRIIFSEVTGMDSYSSNKGFFYADVMDAANRHGVEITYDSLRVKMNRYIKSEYLKKESRGKFQIPVSGYYFFDLL